MGFRNGEHNVGLLSCAYPHLQVQVAEYEWRRGKQMVLLEEQITRPSGTEQKLDSIDTGLLGGDVEGYV